MGGCVVVDTTSYARRLISSLGAIYVGLGRPVFFQLSSQVSTEPNTKSHHNQVSPTTTTTQRMSQEYWI